MLWLFERADEVCELETRYDRESAEYVLAQRASDGTLQIERYANAATFRQRLFAIEQHLGRQRWQPKGPPSIQGEGRSKTETKR
jgi:hypothetical protein